MVEYNGERTVGGMTKFIETGGEYGKAPPEEEEEDYDEDEVSIIPHISCPWLSHFTPLVLQYFTSDYC